MGVAFSGWLITALHILKEMILKVTNNGILLEVCVGGGVAVHLHCRCLAPRGAGGEDGGRNSQLDQCTWSAQ